MQQFLPVRVKVRRHRVVSVAKAIVKSVPSRGVPIYSSECFYDGKKSNSLQFFTPILSLRFLSSLFLLNTMGGGNGQKSAKAREKAQAKAAKGGAGSMLSAFFSFVFSLSLSLCWEISIKLRSELETKHLWGSLLILSLLSLLLSQQRQTKRRNRSSAKCACKRSCRRWVTRSWKNTRRINTRSWTRNSAFRS